jgi:hypothetical protein
VDFLHVRLRAAARLLPALAEFYGGLGIAVTEARPELVTLEVGTSRVDLVRGDGDPFYHFALLAPGDRSEAMAEWAEERTTLLPDPESGEAVFDFTNWSAKACYFHDPAGNIVELIAHRGLGETGTGGRFSADELLGLSELGLVGDPVAMATALRPLGLELWDGTLEGEGRLGFLGERGRTLILCPPGRGWLPTRRPAEVHPLEAALSGPREGEAAADGYRITRSARPRRGGA